MSDIYGVPQGGLMGMFANPQTAGLLGMAGGLLQASGPSRMPIGMGQALGMGMQGLQQGASNAMQMRMEMAKLQAQLDPFGTGFGGPARAPNPMAPQGSPVAGAANVGPLSGLSAGLGGYAPQMNASQSPLMPSNGIGLFGGHTPQEVMMAGTRLSALGNPAGAEMMKIAAQADPSLTPTDITKMGVQGGLTPEQIQAANAAGVSKANYIAPVNARPGAILRDPLTMQPMAFNPNIPAGGSPLFDTSGNVVSIGAIPGAANVTSAMAAAKAAGEGSVLPYSGVDLTGKPLPVTNRTAAATQAGATTPASAAIVQAESGGNPNAVSPKGALGAWQVMPNTNANPGFGVTPAQNNSPAEMNRVGRDYYSAMTSRYGNPTLGAIAYNMGPGATDKWLSAGANWEALPQETRNYVGKVSTLTALNSGAGAPAAPAGGAIYAAPPMGATTAANVSQGAPSKQMADAYGALSNSDSNYQASREALQTMLGIAQNGGISDTAARLLPGNIATRMSNDAAEYEKAHANFVALQGKALGASGTDASRATMEAAVPTFDKPQQAKIQGLTNQLQQLDMSHLKTQFLQPIYQAGDEKAFSKANAGFDQNIVPQMTPILQMSGPPQRSAVQAAIKQNPALRSKFEWAFNNGMLR